MRSLKIVFMGTPEFSVPMLSQLLDSKHQIVGVITMPDKPAGRGLQLIQSPVKEFAIAHNLFLMQPEKLKNEDFIETLKSLEADLFVVVAFRMLPEIVWNMPPLGTVNLHASLLPQYRGAAPINWAIIRGENETGLTTFKLQHQIDTGNIIFQEKMTIGETETVGELYARMMEEGKFLLVKTVDAMAADNYPQIHQKTQESIREAPKLTKETGEINWQNSAKDCFNLIRGLSPYPAAYTTFQGKKMKIFTAEKTTILRNKEEAGSFETDGKTFLNFYAKDYALALLEIQLEGKKRLKIVEFLRGTRLEN